MASPIKLVIDRQNRALVGFNNSVTSIPSLFQSNVQDFVVQVVDPDPTKLPGNYIAVDLSGSGLRMAVGPQPIGTAGGPALLTLQDTWTWDAVNKWFAASLALNVAAIDSFIGAAAQATAWLEVNLTQSGNRMTLLQTTFTLKAVEDELTSIAPTPTDQYLTKAECLALFAKLVNDLGKTIVFKSANGIYGRELGVNNDGTSIDNIITL